MEIIMTKKIKFGFGKKRMRTKAGDKRRENEEPERHRRERQLNNKESGNDDRTRMDVALLYASAGLSVLPLHGLKNGLCTCGDAACDRPGKHARTKGATTKRALIEKYWTKWPKAKIGVVLGTKSGVLAIVTEGSAGKKTLRALEEKAE
jgi:hypothetical protein